MKLVYLKASFIRCRCMIAREHLKRKPVTDFRRLDLCEYLRKFKKWIDNEKFFYTSGMYLL